MRILLVEDDPDTAGLIVHWLARCGHDVHARQSAEDALDALAEGAFDCLVTDVELPGMSGHELVRRIVRGRLRAGRIVVATITDHEDAPADVRPDAWLAKPFRHAELCAAVASGGP